jgi:hypothetical protein
LWPICGHFFGNPPLRDLIKTVLPRARSFLAAVNLQAVSEACQTLLGPTRRVVPGVGLLAILTRELIEPALNLTYWIDQTGAQQPITGYRRAKMASFWMECLLTCDCMIGLKRQCTL